MEKDKENSRPKTSKVYLIIDRAQQTNKRTNVEQQKYGTGEKK